MQNYYLPHKTHRKYFSFKFNAMMALTQEGWCVAEHATWIQIWAWSNQLIFQGEGVWCTWQCTSLTICPGCTMRCMWNQCVPTMGAKQRGRILETEHGDKLLKPQSLFYINYMSLNKHGCTFGRQAITRQ